MGLLALIHVRIVAANSAFSYRYRCHQPHSQMSAMTNKNFLLSIAERRIGHARGKIGTGKEHVPSDRIVFGTRIVFHHHTVF
jgi:hypothetical protein